MKKSNAPGEAQISDAMLAYILPDLFNEEGVVQLQQKLSHADLVKAHTEGKVKEVAGKFGADTSSRVKMPDVIMRKMAQKRLDGRVGYGLDDINDIVGHRIIVKDESQIPAVAKAVEKMAEENGIKILKAQWVKEDGLDYKAFHIDMEHELENGETVHGELQIMTPQNEASAAATHDAHYMYGKEIPQPVKKDLQPMIDDAQELPNSKAKHVAKTIVDLRKQNGDQPLPPIVPKQIVEQAKQ